MTWKCICCCLNLFLWRKWMREWTDWSIGGGLWESSICLRELTSVAASLTGSFFRMTLHCCWQASTSSRVRYSWASSNITWSNTHLLAQHWNVCCVSKESLYSVKKFHMFIYMHFLFKGILMHEYINAYIYMLHLLSCTLKEKTFIDLAHAFKSLWIKVSGKCTVLERF